MILHKNGENMEFNKELIKKIRGLIIFTAVIIVCFWKNEMVVDVLSYGLGIVMPFLIGGAIAFVLNVPMRFIERKLFTERNIKSEKLKKASRGISLMLTITILCSIVAIVFFVVVPQLAITFQSLGSSVQEFVPTIASWADKIFTDNPEIAVMIKNFEYDWGKIASFGFDFLQQGAGSVVGTTVDVLMKFVSALTTFFIAFVFSIYILLQKEELNIQAKKVFFAFMPKGRAEASIEVLELSRSVFSNFLTGQCVEAVVIAVMFVVALLLFRIPFALLIGILIGFTALIPVFGAFLGCFIGAFLIFIESPTKALTFLVIFIIIQQIEGNLIYPYVVGNSVGLPSIWVLAAVSVGASLMGVVGMLIFIPITSVAYALFREIVYIKLRKNEIDPKAIEKKKIG